MPLLTRRRLLLGGGAVLAAAAGGSWWLLRQKTVPIGFAYSDDELARAQAFLAAHPVIDAHAHPGRTFVRGAQPATGRFGRAVGPGPSDHPTVPDRRAPNGQ